MFSRIFIERPRLAMVISIVITLAGLIAIFNIPVAQYPRISPPMITVSAFYPGANSKVLADSVAAPIEAELNGVDNMIYMSSNCSNDGRYELSVTFAVDTDPDIDQINTQNRVQLAIPKLPREVIAQGISVRKRSTDMLGFVSFFSPENTRDRLFLSNYISREIKDTLVRLKGVSDVFIFGELEYSMRIWMNPERLTSMGLTADDVITAVRQQNVQAAVGSIGSEPVAGSQQIQYTLRAKGRLEDVEDFKNIIVRTNLQGGLVRIRDIARVELGAKSYGHNSIINGVSAVTIGIYRATGANSLEVMKDVRDELKRLSVRQPDDVEYRVVYDTTEYVSVAIREIILTLFITFLLVVAVCYIFLQDWRATLVPVITIPVSLIGTFAVLFIIGFNANTISLFALIMAIGLVVDDAIVVVENVYRLMVERKLSPKDAAIRTMKQVTGPVIATTLVLLAVFVPVGFLPGITGQLYKQFAVTLCVSVLISTINALTLSPALCAVLARPPRIIRHGPLAWFNKAVDSSRKVYVAGSVWLIKRMMVVLIIFICVFGTAYHLFKTLPFSFLPEEDKGAFLLNAQLPESSSLARTSKAMQHVFNELKNINGVKDILCVSGFSLLSGNAANVGFGIVVLEPWNKRAGPELQLKAILGQAQKKLAAISSANIFAFVPPAIQGLGTTGGFDFRLKALGRQKSGELAATTRAIVIAANQNPAMMRVFSTYSANTPQIFVNLDRTRAESLNVPVSNVFSTLQAQLGSKYINDFNIGSKVYQVKIQADSSYRDAIEDIEKLYVRSNEGKMVPMKSLTTLSTVLGPQIISRYNQFTSVQVNGSAAPGFSSGEAMEAMERVATETMPKDYTFEWSALSFQEKKSGGQVWTLFSLAFIFAYLFLVGQYESWTIPLSIIISVPVATMGGLVGLWIAGLNLSIYAQTGLVLLVGLAGKNAILIVEFAKTRREQGMSLMDSAMEGAGIRFRPVLMTAFTFILGVAPMVIAVGAGAGSRRSIGTTVFSGMLAATMIGIFLIPSLFYLFQKMSEKGVDRHTQKQNNITS